MILGIIVIAVSGLINKNYYKNENTLLNVFLASSAISTMIVIFLTMSLSHCPSCKKYLTYKKNWIGKHCEHCGILIEEEKEGNS